MEKEIITKEDILIMKDVSNLIARGIYNLTGKEIAYFNNIMFQYTELIKKLEKK